MRKLITGSLMLCSILSLRAQTFVKPAVKVKDTSFAVITDKGTFQACEAELGDSRNGRVAYVHRIQ